MASNYTEHYGLCQWETTDQVLREEFNQDNEKVDTVLNTLYEKNAVLEEYIQKCGNCQIYTTSYAGTGGSGEGSPNSLTFPEVPLLVLISGGQGNSWGVMAKKTAIIIQGGHFTAFDVNNSITWPTIWSTDQKTVSWYSVNSDANGQFNATGVSYTVVALLTAK